MTGDLILWSADVTVVVPVAQMRQQEADHSVAVAAVHRQLYRSSSAHAVDIAPYLLELAAKVEQGCSGSVGPQADHRDLFGV
jgi:two-component sensor histidine kinase